MLCDMLKQDVVKFFGGVTRTSEALGVKHQAVSQWGRVVPERMAYRAERASKGKLKVDPKHYQAAH